MKKWTCCIISAVLILSVLFAQRGQPAVTLSHEASDTAVSENFSQKLVDGIMALFMGLSREEEVSREIVIDLSHGEISDEMLVEIQRIKEEVIQQENQTPPPQVTQAPEVKNRRCCCIIRIPTKRFGRAIRIMLKPVPAER